MANKAQTRILAVNRNRKNLEILAEFLGKEGYEIIPAADMVAVDEVLDSPRADEIGLALLDLSGFDQAIWSRCERLCLLGIPFIIISPQQNPALREASLKHGAQIVLVKPLAVRELLVLIKRFLEGSGDGSCSSSFGA